MDKVMMKIKSPVISIREKCLNCSALSVNEVKNCLLNNCALHPYRLGKNPNFNCSSSKKKYKSSVKSIRDKCIECCNGSKREVKLCPLEDCALHPFRFGKNPNCKGRGNLEALSKYRESL